MARMTPTTHTEFSIHSRRQAVRYRSSQHNQAIVTFKPLFQGKKYINVKVLNISSKGALITTKYPFSLNAKIILNFKIKGGDVWKTPAKIARRTQHATFGIKFDTIQHELIDQLIHHNRDFSLS